MLVEPFHRMFSLDSIALQYPHAAVERVPVCMKDPRVRSVVVDAEVNSLEHRIRRRPTSLHHPSLGSRLPARFPQNACHDPRPPH